jgi:SWI/SNF-related matrix-associated actin-dependent regulator 1 of chromatin subfamily A
MVICDEAHYLKNPDTNRCELLVPFLSQKKRVFLLTGTPALAKPRELFNLLKILRCDVFKSFEHFGDRYCERRQNPWTFKWEFDGARNLAELHYILKKTVMIRRLKQDVLPQLPPKQRQIIFM